jgi:hypothetical protein
MGGMITLHLEFLTKDGMKKLADVKKALGM